jgi:hypothetical protein
VNPEQWADELIGRVERARPEVVRLAELASLAAQVDAPLLRRLRQQFLPGSDPGLEADLWFSPLLEAQDDECGTFHEPVVLRLRERLRIRLQATDEPAFNRVASLTRTAHAHLPEALRLEELLTAWAIRAEIWDRTHMEQALAPALGALAGADDAHALEVARWAMQAAGRLPESVRSLLPMQALLVASALRLQQPSLASTAAGPLTLAATDLSWLVPAATDAARVRLGVALLPHGVRFDEPESGGLAFELPRTTPLLVSLGWRDTAGPHQRLAQVAPGTLVEIEGDFGAVDLVTLAGDRYTLSGTLAGKATVTVSAQATLGDATVDAKGTVEPSAHDVPASFLEGCVLVESLGSQVGPVIAFPLADGLWVTPREPVGTIPFVGVVGGATGDQLALANAEEEGARVSIWRPLVPDRAGQPLPLLAATSPPEGLDWWTVGFVEGRAQVLRLRLLHFAPDALALEGPRSVSYHGAPVLCGDAVAGVVIHAAPALNSNDIVGSQVLRCEPAGALQIALARVSAVVPHEVPASAATCARFIPDTRHLLVGGGDGFLRLYDSESGALRSELAAHEGPLLSLAFLGSSDGTVASGGNDRTLKVSNLESPSPTRTLRLPHPPRAIAGHPNEKKLTIGFADGTLQMVTSGSRGWVPYKRRDPAAPLTGGLNALASVGAGDRVLSAADDGRLVLWAREELTPIAELRDESEPAAPALSVATEPSGRLAVAGYADRTVRLWDLDARRVERTMRGHHRDGVSAVAISPDGLYIVSGGTDGSVCLWMPRSDSLTTLIEGGPRVRAAAASADGPWVATAHDDGLVRVWDASSASPLRSFRLGSARVFLCYAAADFALAASVSRGLLVHGIVSFVDRSDSKPGDPPDESVRRAIDRSELVVPILSPRSLDRPWLEGEVAHARSVGKPLLAIVTRERSSAAFEMPDWMGSTEPLVLTPHELETSATEVSFRIAERLDSPAPPQEASAGTKGPAAPPRKKASARKQGSGSMTALPRPTRRKK